MVQDVERLPNINELAPNHVPGHGLRDKVGGEFKKAMAGRETCASQVCYALNRTGAFIDKLDRYSNPAMIKGGVPRALKGGDGYLYIFSVIDMVVYLNGRHGTCTTLRPHNAVEQLQGVEGIIAYGYRHIDIWAKWQNERPFEPHYYNCIADPSTKKHGVFFWPLFRRSNYW